MLTCVFFNFRQKSDILIIPVATLFAFTQLRGSMPGAPPGFGKCYLFYTFRIQILNGSSFKGDILGIFRLSSEKYGSKFDFYEQTLLGFYPVSLSSPSQ